MNLDFESLRENVLKNEVEVESAEKELSNALESANEALKISGNGLSEAKEYSVTVSEMTKENVKSADDTKEKVIEKNEALSESKEEKTVEVKEEKKSWFTKMSEASMLGQVFSAVGKVGETLIDSLAKKFLKDKYKLNYSVYNNSKKAIVAATKKDAITFVKKGLDAVVGALKWIKPTTKMVIRNVKNKVVDEGFGIIKTLFVK